MARQLRLPHGHDPKPGTGRTANSGGPRTITYKKARWDVVNGDGA